MVSTSPEIESPSLETTAKYAALIEQLKQLESVLVSFSGGVDSTLLLYAAHEALGSRAVAATGLSQTYASEEMDEANALAERIGVEHIMVSTMELTDPRYANNTHQRCFFCKTELYTKLGETARERGLAHVIDGTNADDLGDFRPGIRAARSLQVTSPLAEVGLTKQEIRQLSAQFDLPTWDKPAVACLSSRFAYGDPITVEKLRKVAAAETAVRKLGFRGFRVRHHDEVARIEMPAERMLDALAQASAITAAVKEAGYLYVALDLDGYRAGSQNEVLHARLKPGGLRREGNV